MYEGNPQNVDFDEFPFYGDEILITRWPMYSINYYILEGFNNGSIIYIYTNSMLEE